MKKFLSVFLVFASGFAASAMTNDAILGAGDSFACDAFARGAKVACMPNVNSNYHGRTSFPSQPALIISNYQVVDCMTVGGDRDVICAPNTPPPPSYPPTYPPAPPIPVETRRAYTTPDFNCLQNLPTVNDADDLVSNAFLPSSRLVDRCEPSRDLREIRRMESYGFRCTIDTTAFNQSDAMCVENLLSKVVNKSTIKGSHRRRLESEFCATKTYNCVR
jgi:hypothetical protein